MAIKRMNHAVLYVRDAERTYEFYRDVLGFRVVGEMPGAKFLQAPDSTNDHDLALFSIGAEAGDSTAGRSTVGLYHIAWEVQTLGDLQEISLRSRTPARWWVPPTTAPRRRCTRRTPTGSSSRCVGWCPNVSWTRRRVEAKTKLRPLNLDADIERYGLETVGGVCQPLSRNAERVHR